MTVRTSAALAFDPEVLKANVLRERCGFLSSAEVAQLAAHPSSRLWPLLVRCGGCRFVAAAQDVRHLIALVESGRDGDGCAGDGSGDYVRDVSFPAFGGSL